MAEPTPPPKQKPGQSKRAYGAQWKRWANKKNSDGITQQEAYDRYRAGQKSAQKGGLAEEVDWRTQEAAKLKAKNANKPGYDSAGNPLSEVEKLNQRKSQERKDSDWQTNPDFDRETGGWKDSARTALTIANRLYGASGQLKRLRTLLKIGKVGGALFTGLTIPKG